MCLRPGPKEFSPRKGVDSAAGAYLLDDKPVFTYAFSNQPQDKFRIASDRKLTAGKHSVIHFDFRYDGGGIGKSGTGTLSVDAPKSPLAGSTERSAFASR